VKWLRTAGPLVADEDGEPVRLRGVGVGGWLNMENFITGYPSTESSHRAAMLRALGPRRHALFFDSFLTHFFGPDDAAFIASLGLNCVRIPVSYRHWEDDARPGEIKPEGFRHLDRAIDACAAAGLYTVIDLHAVPGAQSHHWHSDNPFHRPLFWQQRSFQDRAVAWWEAVAARYAARPEVAGYNVLNEPADESGTALVAFYRRAVAAIRAVDPRHMVFLDGNRYAREFPGFGDPLPNAVYAVHQYPAPGFAGGRPLPRADRRRVRRPRCGPRGVRGDDGVPACARCPGVGGRARIPGIRSVPVRRPPVCRAASAERLLRRAAGGRVRRVLRRRV
jgi:endoglucanase